MAEVCAQHPEVPAVFYCDGCGKRLCPDCIRKGHALLFCTLCGERALPLDADQPASPQEMARREAISKPYSLGEALAYPFRGAGLSMFLAALVSIAFVTFLLEHPWGCLPFVLAAGLWSLMIGLQFKIVRSTAEGDHDLPDWPDYADWGERVMDILTYLVIAALQFLPAVGFVLLNMDKVLTAEPSLLFWAVFSVLAWIGTALGTVAFGAAGRFDRSDALRVDLHLQALRIGGADAVTVTNLVFALSILLAILRALLLKVPFVGAAATGILGAYWTFTSAHLAGVLFRRHLPALEKIYD